MNKNTAVSITFIHCGIAMGQPCGGLMQLGSVSMNSYNSHTSVRAHTHTQYTYTLHSYTHTSNTHQHKHLTHSQTQTYKLTHT